MIHTAFSGSNLVFIFSPEVLEIHTHLLTLTNPKTHVCLLSVQTNLFSIVPWGRKEVIREVTRNKLRISNCICRLLLHLCFSQGGDHVLQGGRGVKVSWSPMTWFSYKKGNRGNVFSYGDAGEGECGTGLMIF